MQSQNYQDDKILKREDELTDISQMPKEQLNAIAAKPAYTQTDAPASTSTTMQSVSMNEVPREGEENILGSVASIHDQMQPGSFMSPISDRKSGSIENLSTEDKATSTEPGMFKEGVEAVKEAFHISKEERADIKSAIVTEAEALGEAITYFVNVAAEKIDGAVTATANKIVEIAHTLEHKAVEIQHDLGLDSAAGKEMRGAQPTTAEMKVSELKDTMAKKAYLMRKSARNTLSHGGRKFEKLEKNAAMAAGFAKVYLREEAKDLQRRARRYKKDWKKDAKDTKGALKHSFNQKGRQLDGKVREFENEALHNAQLAKGVLQKDIAIFQDKASAFGNEFMNESGKAIRILRQEGRLYQGKAKAYFSQLRKENKLAMDSIKEGGKELYEKARQYERDFSEDFVVSDYLREKASYLRSGARRLYNEISRSAYLGGSQQGKSQDFSASGESKSFLLDISAHDWNGNSFSTSRFSDNSESSKFLLEIPASEWNFSSPRSTRQRAGQLNSRAQGWMDQASKGFALAQKRFQTQSGEFEKGARNFFNDASRKAREFMGDFSDSADSAKRMLIEKKSDLQFQAELLTQDRFPSQEALAKKQAINAEVRKFHKGSNKENLSQ